ncbi:MAG: site-specific integrase [Solirubrobacterales bacterium]
MSPRSSRGGLGRPRGALWPATAAPPGRARLGLRAGTVPDPRPARGTPDRDPLRMAAVLQPACDYWARVSEAIALRWRDLERGSPPCLWVRRSIVDGVVGAPKSRFGRRCLPLPEELMERLVALRPRTPVRRSSSSLPRPAHRTRNNIRHRVLFPAIERAGVPRVGFHAFRHTCASLLIERGLSPLRLQRWMGHHSAAYTLDVYGHLIDAELAPPLDLTQELGQGR